MACGILVPWPRNQGSNSCPLQWKRTVLTTGPPGNSGKDIFKSEGFQNLPPVSALSFHRESESKWESKQRKAPDPVSRGPVDMTHAGNSQDEVKGNAAWPTTAAGRAWAQTAQSKQGHGPGGVTPRENRPDKSSVEDCSPSRLPCGSDGKESACNAGDSGSTPGWGRCPGEGNGYPLFQYSCLKNPKDRGPWQATVHRIAKSWTRLSNWHPPFAKYFGFFHDTPPSSAHSWDYRPLPPGWKGWPKNLLDPTYREQTWWVTWVETLRASVCSPTNWLCSKKRLLFTQSQSRDSMQPNSDRLLSWEKSNKTTSLL